MSVLTVKFVNKSHFFNMIVLKNFVSWYRLEDGG